MFKDLFYFSVFRIDGNKERNQFGRLSPIIAYWTVSEGFQLESSFLAL